jgi:hypothetical protein
LAEAQLRAGTDVTDSPEVTGKKQGGAPPFKPGQSGNPKGRPKGSKNKLTEAFWCDFAEAWEAHGVTALEKVATTDPGKFITVAASVMPKDVNVNTTITDMTDEQLESRIASLARQFGDALGVVAGNGVSPDGEEAAPRSHEIN